MNNWLELLKKKNVLLTVSLVVGVSSFIIIQNMLLLYMNHIRGAMLLGLFFSPAIICGVALIQFKQIRALQEQERLLPIKVLSIIYAILILLAILFAISIAISIFNI